MWSLSPTPRHLKSKSFIKTCNAATMASNPFRNSGLWCLSAVMIFAASKRLLLFLGGSWFSLVDAMKLNLIKFCFFYVVWCQPTEIRIRCMWFFAEISLCEEASEMQFLFVRNIAVMSKPSIMLEFPHKYWCSFTITGRMLLLAFTHWQRVTPWKDVKILFFRRDIYLPVPLVFASYRIRWVSLLSPLCTLGNSNTHRQHLTANLVKGHHTVELSQSHLHSLPQFFLQILLADDLFGFLIDRQDGTS